MRGWMRGLGLIWVGLLGEVLGLLSAVSGGRPPATRWITTICREGALIRPCRATFPHQWEKDGWHAGR